MCTERVCKVVHAELLDILEGESLWPLKQLCQSYLWFRLILRMLYRGKSLQLTQRCFKKLLWYVDLSWSQKHVRELLSRQLNLCVYKVLQKSINRCLSIRTWVFLRIWPLSCACGGCWTAIFVSEVCRWRYNRDSIIWCENYNLSSGGKVVSLLITTVWLARFYTQCRIEDQSFPDRAS